MDTIECALPEQLQSCAERIRVCCNYHKVPEGRQSARAPAWVATGGVERQRATAAALGLGRIAATAGPEIT